MCSYFFVHMMCSLFCNVCVVMSHNQLALLLLIYTVNVRVPSGLKPGDEFIFEVDRVATNSSGTTTSTKSSNKKNESKSKSSKNPKKRKGHNNNNDSNTRGDSSSSRDYHGNTRGGAPSFVTGFFSLYNQVYDILSTTSAMLSGDNDDYYDDHDIDISTSNSFSRKNSKDKSNNSVTSQVKQHDPDLPLLDREIYHKKDLLTALAVGTFIGLSIVTGFLAGVLWVTPIESMEMKKPEWKDEDSFVPWKDDRPKKSSTLQRPQKNMKKNRLIINNQEIELS